MAQKTPVTFLQEKCVSQKINVPYYEEIPSNEDIMFTFRVEALGASAEGTGPSKQEAKHLAAANLLTILGDDITTLSTPDSIRPEKDNVVTLLDICVARNLDKAVFETIDARGPSHAPSFTVQCKVANIVRVAKHSTKKGAKQLAAKAMLEVIQSVYPEEKKVLVPLEQSMKNNEERNSYLFKNYREWKDSDQKSVLGLKLADRHNFFVNLLPDRVARALSVFSLHETDKEKVHLLADALGFPLKIYPENSVEGPPLIVLELTCDFETTTIGTEETVYRDFLTYMKVMLH
ncbi:interferon-inducible double-stranded RNA-dependent protein kinase activator A homolog [Sergentomyia squamirostris]